MHSSTGSKKSVAMQIFCQFTALIMGCTDMKTLTCICMENSPGYPDPLIYTVEVSEDITFEDLQSLVREQRLEDLGEEMRDEVYATFRLCFAFEGDHHPIYDERI